jgi:hypothetical protein
MWYLFCLVVMWVSIPGTLFRGPLFETKDITYAPRGVIGYLVLFGFYIALSLAISFTFRAVIRRKERRHHI